LSQPAKHAIVRELEWVEIKREGIAEVFEVVRAFEVGQ